MNAEKPLSGHYISQPLLISRIASAAGLIASAGLGGYDNEGLLVVELLLARNKNGTPRTFLWNCRSSSTRLDVAMAAH